MRTPTLFLVTLAAREFEDSLRTLRTLRTLRAPSPILRSL